MNKISFPRVDIYNNQIVQKDLEDWYVDKIESKIAFNLKNISCSKKESINLDKIITDLKDILLANPNKLRYYSTIYKGAFNHKTRNAIQNAFDYETHRKDILVELAEKINVKSCPYCNMSYTLIAKKANGEKLAKLQFDHFYNKRDYPMLSMSLYNLIPSCSVCNQGKSTGDLDIRFNPYYGSINDTFVFKVRNPIPLYTGKKKGDFIDIDAIATSTSQKDIKDFDKYKETFHIETLYQRHGDVAKEIFDKAYLYPYINEDDNFKMLPNYSKEYRKQLWLGTYTTKEDIEKRPLTKLKQDLWKQATQFWHSKEDF